MSRQPTDLEGAALGDELAVSLYEHPLPSFIGTELERLYKNVFSSIARLCALGQLQQARAYVARRNGEVSGVLLFRLEGRAAHVYNEVIALDQDDIGRFASTLFASYETLAVISFEAIRATIGRLPYPYQQFNCLEDIVLDLPGTTEAYFSALGKNMRTSLKRYQKKIAADFPDFHYAVYETDQVSEQHVADIVALSSARMASKNQVSAHTDSKTAELLRLVQAHGVVGVATIDGRVVAGVICTLFGGNVFMHVIAHDPAYNQYRIGKLCCYLSICDAIGRRANEYHFLWGRYEYKYRLLGLQRDLDRVVLYRSRVQLLLNWPVFCRTAVRGYGRRAKHWLLEEKQQARPIWKLVMAAYRRIQLGTGGHPAHAGEDGG